MKASNESERKRNSPSRWPTFTHPTHYGRPSRSLKLFGSPGKYSFTGNPSEVLLLVTDSIARALLIQCSPWSEVPRKRFWLRRLTGRGWPWIRIGNIIFWLFVSSSWFGRLSKPCWKEGRGIICCGSYQGVTLILCLCIWLLQSR